MATHAAFPRAPRLVRDERLSDAGIAVVVFAVSLALFAAGTHLEGHRGQIDVPGVALTALASLPLAARRVAPLAVFVVTAVASAALLGIALPAGPPLGPTLALYYLSAAEQPSRGRLRLTAVVVVAMLIAHVTASGLAADRFPGPELVFGVVVWGGAWLAGERSRLRRERIAELEERALRAEREADRERRLAAAEERARIARDLHDSAGHAINVILVHAGLGRLRSANEPEAARDEFETIEQVARETIGEIDKLVGALREEPAHAQRRDEVEPPPGLAALDALVERHRAAGLEVTKTIRGDRRSLSPSVDRGAYRILQEALTNAARHGDGGAQLELNFEPDLLELSVVNPLRNEPGTDANGGGHGLIGMRERATLLGGSLVAGARQGRFEVRARLLTDRET
ncbi:MAG TPA: histidine kinase [Thermoleophilaceae bacterium]